MIKFKLFNNFNTKKKIALIALLILALLFILGKNYISEVVKSPSIRIHLINIAKVAIPLKNLILMRDVDDKIALLESSGSCVFCDLTQGNFKGSNLKGVDLRHAILIGANLSNNNLSLAILRNANLSGADLRGTNLTEADLRGTNLTEADLRGTNLTEADLSGANFKGADLSGVNLTKADLKNSYLARANLSNVSLDGVDFRNTDLTGANLNGVDLSNKDLTGANLSGVDLSNKDLTGTILTHSNLSEANLDGVDLRYTDLTGANLSGVDFSYKDLTGANLSGVDLSNKDFTGTSLLHANLAGANLDGVDLSNKDLTGANLSGVDLSNKDFTGTSLLHANLAGANLDGVDLSNKDLTGANLSGVDLSNKDLTGTILKDAKKIEINLKNPSNSNWPALNEIQNLNVTRYDLSGDVQYIATKKGFLFESKNNESRLVLDLNNDAQFPFYDKGGAGFLGIASQNELVYVAYSSKDPNGLSSLVVDEYSMNFSKVRNIIKIAGFQTTHFGGNLLFDNHGKLYLSVGDGELDSHAQNLNFLKGKILRLDVSKLKLEPEIVAYGIRNPWGVTIDSKDRMFILQCGEVNVEAVYLLNDLYSDIPANFGWPVFEGSMRMREDPLMFKDVLAPIFEKTKRPGCLTAGVYLNDIESFLFADFYGAIGLLKQQENGEWYLFHEDKQEKDAIWGFGLDKKTRKIFVAPNNLELEILVDQVKLD
jgi:uncharacterized protein YjbI with pentapeptide repeats